MKLIQTIVLSGTILLASSCKFFNESKRSINDIDSLTEQIDEVVEEVYVDTTPQVIEEPEPVPVVNNRYFMIVGSFQIEQNAQRLADELVKLGYMSEIHYASNGYYRVSAKGYENFRTGVNEIDLFRASLTPNAWLYVKN